MEKVLLTIIVSFLLSMVWAPLLINALYTLKVVRKLDTDLSSTVGDRYLKAGTPIMGGILVIVTTIALTLIFNRDSSVYIPILVLVSSALLGGIDDLMNIFGRTRLIRPIQKQLILAKVHKSILMRIYYWITLPWNWYKNIWYFLGSYPGSGIHAGEKIIIQIISGSFVAWWVYWEMGWDSIWIPFIDPIYLGWLMPIFIIFTVVSMTNAVNISDGMDGLSSGLILSSFIAFTIIAFIQGNMPIALLCATVVGSTLAYLYFNIKPARIQMGDVGTLGLGAFLAAIAFTLDRSILLPIIGALFMLEIGSSLFQALYKAVFSRRYFKMAPLHLHFQIIGWSEEKVVMRFWLMSWVLAIIGIYLSMQ